MKNDQLSRNAREPSTTLQPSRDERSGYSFVVHACLGEEGSSKILNLTPVDPVLCLPLRFLPTIAYLLVHRLRTRHG